MTRNGSVKEYFSKKEAMYQIEHHIEYAKQEDWCDFNQGFIVGMIMAYYYADLLSQDEVNQILSKNGLDMVNFDDEEE